MRLLIFLILISSFFVSCGGVRSNNPRNPETSEERREGDISDLTVEEITDRADSLLGRLQNAAADLWKKVDECESSTSGVPRNTADIVFSMASKVNPGAKIRTCAEQGLEKASEDICQSHKELDTLYIQTRNRGEARARVERAYENALVTEQRYRDNLYEQSVRFYKEADVFRNKKDRTGKWVDKNAYGYLEGEYEALADIFDLESNISCRDRINRR